ncbi:MAG: GvpL/GvpF family gas vesicle protein [Jatrophihabitans sp.]|uniref:GvpL/GvpF family gas vesicle protein n=1 Tax=Jatrophihabitans sp. TaxID=1932789 RepID=UPI003F7FD56D
MTGIDSPPASGCLYLYGIVEVTAATPELLLRGDRLVVVRSVGALCRDLDASALDDLTDDSGAGLLRLAEQHDAVLRRHATAGAVLPVRLGTLYADTERVTAMLHASHDQLQQQLRALRGRAEWTVRVRFPTAAAPAAPMGRTSGRDYLLQRRTARRAVEDERARRERIVAQLDEELRELSDDVRTRRRGAEAAHVASYLVPHEAAEAFARRMTEAAATLGGEGVEVVLDGPLPAWSFADVRLEVRR